MHLGDRWQEIVFEFSVPDPEVRALAVVAEVRGERSEALLPPQRVRLMAEKRWTRSSARVRAT